MLAPESENDFVIQSCVGRYNKIGDTHHKGEIGWSVISIICKFNVIVNEH